MIKREYIRVTFIVFSFFILHSCVSTKTVILKNDFPFLVIEAYFQKNIPGTESQKSFYEINVALTELSNEVSVDSVFFNGDKLPLSKWQGGSKIIFSAKAKDEVLQNSYFLKDTIKPNQLILIGSKLDEKLYFLIDSVNQKADIYLP